jgi:hypothetical protein
MVIKDWQDDWRVLVLIEEIPTDKRADAGQEQTPIGVKIVPNMPNPSQKPTQKNKGVAPKKVTQAGKKDTTQAPKE